MMKKHALQKLFIFYSESFDPWLNLATERWLFEQMAPEDKILFLWRNDKSVIIGRFQNPWVECHLTEMAKRDIKFARRQSGGGTVYHDLGNTNFSFMEGQKKARQRKGHKLQNNEILLQALRGLKIDAKVSGRGDLVIPFAGGDKKISGSACKEKSDRFLHHGTMLINAKLDDLSRVLTAPSLNIMSRGICSVRSPVCNLSQINAQITHELFCREMQHVFFNRQREAHKTAQILDKKFLMAQSDIEQYYREFKSWGWRFGETPKFKQFIKAQFAWGNIDLSLESQKGKIMQIKIASDSLHPEMMQIVSRELMGIKYLKRDIEEGVARAKMKLPMIGDYLDELQVWLCEFK